MGLTKQQLAYIAVALLAGFTIGMIFGSQINPGGDLDRDGVSDLVDNCPFIYNPNQEDVEPQNNIGDICDLELFGGKTPGNRDFDGDREPNSSDACPWNPNCQ